MLDVQEMLKRQAVWQRSRQSLTWPEKIRMAEKVRESVKQLRASSGLTGKQETSTQRKIKDQAE
jgi:hypothetical protein